MLDARGIPFDCFEKGSQVGGNWRYENDNGMSSAYRSLHINTSRRVMAFKSLPMPDHYPDYPDHFQMAAYFDEFVDHFGLREKIRFRTEVVKRRAGRRRVGGDDRGRRGRRERTERYRAVLVANGHHWDPRWPEPAFPGAEEFEGEQIHAHHYREPDVLRGKRVLVLGIGNSAIDIAVESSRIAEKTFLAMRRGAYVMPKYINGKPIDELLEPDHGDDCRSRCSASSRCERCWHRRRRHDRLRAAQARPQAVRGPPDGLLGAAAPARPRRHRGRSPTSTASPAAARSASSTAARRRSTSSSTAPATR